MAVAAELVQQQRGDQVAADDEEDVDAEKAARDPVEAGVVAEHGQHRERPHRVDPRHVGEAAVLRPAHPLRNLRRSPPKSPLRRTPDPIQSAARDGTLLDRSLPSAGGGVLPGRRGRRGGGDAAARLPERTGRSKPTNRGANDDQLQIRPRRADLRRHQGRQDPRLPARDAPGERSDRLRQPRQADLSTGATTGSSGWRSTRNSTKAAPTSTRSTPTTTNSARRAVDMPEFPPRAAEPPNTKATNVRRKTMRGQRSGGAADRRRRPRAKESGGEPQEKVLLEGWCQQSSSHSIGDLALRLRRRALRQRRRRRELHRHRLRPVREPLRRPARPKGIQQAGAEAEGGSLRSQSRSAPHGKSAPERHARPDRSGHRRRLAEQPARRPSTQRERPADRRLRLPQSLPVRHQPDDSASLRRQRRCQRLEEIDRPIPMRRAALQLGLALLRSLEHGYEFDEARAERLQTALRHAGLDRGQPFFYYSHFEPG